MNTEQLYAIFCKSQVVCTDSRQIAGNSLFFALKGDNFDGNLFAASALEKGAAFSIVDNPEVAVSERFIVVDNVLTTLQQLAAFHRRKLGLPVIAITGTNGKTTTKELTAAVLSTQKRVEYTRGNLNNHIGVPLTLLSMTPETEMGIVEMGANHPGEIDFLCRIADPDFGIVTNLGKAHLEGFGGFEGVIRTKSELYRFLEAKNGTIFINGDSRILNSAAGNRINKVCYGTSEDNWMRGTLIRKPPYLNLRAYFPQAATEIKSKLIGDYNFENVLAALTIGRYFGIDPDKAVHAVESYEPSNNRSQLISSGTNTVIMDAYNANPASMQASIDNFLGLDASQKMLILGDMLELGADSAREHQKIVDLLANYPRLTVFLVGPQFSSTLKPVSFISFTDSEKLKVYLSNHPVSDSLILVKGSHGIKLEKVISVIN